VPDLSIKERCCKRLEGLKQNRKSYESDAREISSYALPARSRWLASDTNKGRQPNRRLNNSHGIFAFRTLQGGMTSGLSSQSRPWFTLTCYDEALAQDPAVRAWLTEVERRMYAFIAQTNFYGAAKSGYLELGAFGTESCVAFEHKTEGMVCNSLTFGEYWIGLNSALQAGCLYREAPLTVIQAIQSFGLDAVSTRVRALYDTSRYDETIVYYHAIEENDELDQGRLGWRGQPWRSAYWEKDCGRQDELTSLKGCYEQPFWAPRWDSVGGDAWGQGPGHDALPDLRELQLQAKRKAEATDFHIHPEIVTSTKVKLKRQPKNVVSSSEVDITKATDVPYEVPYQAIQAIREDIAELKEAINQATYADLFMAITNMQGIQPRNIEEIAARNEEKLTQLGPVIERVNNEKLEIVVDRVFGIMSRAGLLPPAPDAMRNQPDIKIEFVSILTQMQRMVGLGQIERTVGFVSQVSAIYPQARYKLDPFELIDEYASRAGAPAKLIRPTEDAQGDADAEAQAAQNAQLAEAAAKLGAPIKSVTDAAKVAGEIGQGAMPFAGAAPL
jgi:hypothetical protein